MVIPADKREVSPLATLDDILEWDWLELEPKAIRTEEEEAERRRQSRSDHWDAWGQEVDD